MIKVGTSISKTKMFRFENFWVQISGFLETVELHWHSTAFYNNAAKTLAEKFKQTRRGLKAWSKGLSKLNTKINNCSWVIGMMDGLEDQRSLSRIEANFRKILKKFLLELRRKECTGNKELP